MRITELFQPGKSWDWEFRGSEEAVATFSVKGVNYTFHAYGTDGVWEVEFHLRGGGGSHGEKFGISGTGNSAEVFGTVVDIMREFLNQYKDLISSLRFSAKEDSRQSLYAKMAQRLLPDWGFYQDGQDIVLTSPDTEVDENFDDGKNPGRKGLSRRVGIPKKATLGQLEKIARSSTGERRRMAQWQLNMRRGRKK